MKKLVLFVLLTISQLSSAHEMQHGFIISPDDQFFDHLVATGHHSHQLGFIGSVHITDPQEEEFYQERKKLSGRYFLFQAQKLNLPEMYDGQELSGHIIESMKGDYTPRNVIVREARIKVKKILINMVNPFFGN